MVKVGIKLTCVYTQTANSTWELLLSQFVFIVCVSTRAASPLPFDLMHMLGEQLAYHLLPSVEIICFLGKLIHFSLV